MRLESRGPERATGGRRTRITASPAISRLGGHEKGRDAARVECSTISRDVSLAATTIAAAAVVPGGAGVIGVGLALAFTAATGLLRIGTGENYLSDVLLTLLAMHIVAWIVFRLLRRPDDPPPADDAVEAWFEHFGASLRLWVRERRVAARWLTRARATPARRAAGPAGPPSCLGGAILVPFANGSPCRSGDPLPSGTSRRRKCGPSIRPGR